MMLRHRDQFLSYLLFRKKHFCLVDKHCTTIMLFKDVLFYLCCLFFRFKKLCIRAYIALRQRGHLLIRLFMMMLTSGIPQLTSVNDLDYIKKETLALHLSDEDAVKQFSKKMEESLNSMSTKINWTVHLMAHTK